MSQAEVGRNDVSLLLAGAAKAIAGVRYCWLVTEAETGGANARPMGRLLPAAEENDWTIRFVTDGRSRKASDVPARSDSSFSATRTMLSLCRAAGPR